jgi:hypothetical protein
MKEIIPIMKKTYNHVIIMYKELLESIENAGINDPTKSKLESYCLQYVFSWNPFKRVQNSEPYKMMADKELLEVWKKAGITECCAITEKNRKRIRSEIIKRTIEECLNNSYKDDFVNTVCSKIAPEDIKMAFILKAMEEHIRQKRLQAIFANIFSILSLVISSIVALMVAVLSNIGKICH